MKPCHPQDEEWMSLLYGETSSHQNKTLKRHLAQCGLCQSRYQQWRQTMRVLDQDQVKLHARQPGLAFSPSLRWAAAAAVLLTIGFLAGRLVLAQAGASDAWMAAMEKRVRTQVKTEMEQQWDQHQAALLAQLQAQYQAGLDASTSSLLQSQQALATSLAEAERGRQEQMQEMWNGMLQAQADHRRDLSALRKDLETVAVYSEGRWFQTEETMLRLAGYSTPQAPSDPASQPSTIP